MILVDTSVWVDHLRKSEPVLNTLLSENNVLMHPMVIGELACGPLPNRNQTLANWRNLPMINELSHERVILLIGTMNLMHILAQPDHQNTHLCPVAVCGPTRRRKLSHFQTFRPDPVAVAIERQYLE